jgi:hypothetical protein
MVHLRRRVRIWRHQLSKTVTERTTFTDTVSRTEIYAASRNCAAGRRPGEFRRRGPDPRRRTRVRIETSAKLATLVANGFEREQVVSPREFLRRASISSFSFHSERPRGYRFSAAALLKVISFASGGLRYRDSAFPLGCSYVSSRPQRAPAGSNSNEISGRPTALSNRRCR